MEAGSVALPDSVYAGVEGFSAIQKGKILTELAGGGVSGWLKVMASSNMAKAMQLFLEGTGLTPGAALAALAGLEAADLKYPTCWEDHPSSLQEARK
jgi:hypothetical protein